MAQTTFGQQRWPALLPMLMLVLVLLAACSKPHEFTGVLLEQPRPVHNATGVNQFGDTFQLDEHKGKYVLVNFGYTFCPDICPLTLSEMAQFYRTLEEESPALIEQLDVLFVTVDPKRDTPEQLEKYVGAFHQAFTGVHIQDEAELETTKAAFAVFSEIAQGSDPDSDDYFVDHTGGIIVLNPDGEWMLYFPHDVKADVILADMVALLEG